MRLLLLILFANTILGAQDTTYFDKKRNIVAPGNAYCYQVLIFQEENEDKAVVKEFYAKDNSIKLEATYFSFEEKTYDGSYKTWHENRSLESALYYREGKLNGTQKRFYDDGTLKYQRTEVMGKNDGEFTTYWPSGKMKRQDFYADGKFLSGKCFDENGLEVTYYDYEYMPTYPGGENALINEVVSNVKYPLIARKKGLEGMVVVYFVVDKDGSVTNVNVPKSVHPLLDEEAIKAVKNLKKKFRPGQIDGNLVKVVFACPVKFRLQ